MTELQILRKKNTDLRTQIFNLRAKAELAAETKKCEIKALKNEAGVLERTNSMLQKSIASRDDTIALLIRKPEAGRAGNVRLREENEELSAGIAKLKKRIEKDSSNSGKPPTSDGFRKPRPTSSREKSGRKPGGQAGHPGRTLEMFDDPDEIIEKKTPCCDCGGEIIYNGKYKAKQKPDVKIIFYVTGERAMEGRCSICGKMHHGQFSEGYESRVSYGDGIKALSLLLSERGFVTINRTAEIINSLSRGRLGIRDSTIVNFKSEFAQKLDGEITAVMNALENSDVVNADETTCRNNGKKDWAQVVSNTLCTLYMHNNNRGDLCEGDADVLEAFIGTIVHDHFKSYYRYSLAKHAECNVHILRYLRGIILFFSHEWAKKMRDLLLDAKKQKEELMDAGKGEAPPREIQNLIRRYDAILREGQAEYEKEIQGRKNTGYYDDERLLLKRMREYKDEHLLFFVDFRVPFGNNLAEQDIGFFKSKMRVSGTFRGNKGADDFLRTLSIISTARKLQLNIYDTITGIMNGETPIANALTDRAS